MLEKTYVYKNVDEAAVVRTSLICDELEKMCVSFSGSIEDEIR